MDSQKAQRARIELQTLKMTWPEIDEYISKFESIAHEASYNPVDPNTMQQFLQGLPQSIGQKVLKDTMVEMYEQMKKKVISITASQHIIHTLYKQPTRSTPRSLISKQPGKHEDNTSKAAKANSLRDKGSAKPLSTPLPHQKHGIINWSQWTSTELEHQEETGEVKGEVHRGEM